MRLESRWMCASLGIVGILAHHATAIVTEPVPLSVTPSTKWYGIDGTWSAISLRLGSPQQWFDILISTVSSETWVPGIGSCIVNDTLCSMNKGNLFRPLSSTTWEEQGFFDLGVDYQLGNTAYAEYGLDNLTFANTGVTVPSSIIGAYNGSAGTNTSSYFNGMFGLGITPGNFTSVSPLSVISALVEELGAIPSHSYGYTAGANYQLKGVLNSLTLGGYDANRLVPHNVTFTLSASKAPQTFVNNIYVTSGATVNTTASTVSLLKTADRVTAIIDSSTPFLWLPAPVCERFASALGLSYNDTLNLYTFDGNASQHDVLAASQLSFTFSLSDFAAASESVNITLPYSAFDLKLIYPAIPNTNYGGKDSTKFYFPLRQALNEAQYTIGRAFMQEAYLITDYERNTFSVHQAVHVLDSITNTSIIAITRPSSSSLTGNPIPIEAKYSFPEGALIGIAVGAATMVALSITLGVLLYKRSHRRHPVSDDKVYDVPPPGRTFMDRFRRTEDRPVAIVAHEASGSEAFPVEADATYERYELPAAMPAELESVSGESLDRSTGQGYTTQETEDIAGYERARRKMERQQNLAIIQSHMRPMIRPPEKQEQDISPLAHYRPLNGPVFEASAMDSPMVSPMGAEFGSVLGIYSGSSGNPSPVSPGFPVYVQTPLSPPPPTYRRINPENVIYAGRLPDNVQLPFAVPRIIEPSGSPIQDGDEIPQGYGTHDSLGSQYTLQEEAALDLYNTTTSSMPDLYNADTPPARSPTNDAHINTLESDHGSEMISPLTSTSSGSVALTFGRRTTRESPTHPQFQLQVYPEAGLEETDSTRSDSQAGANMSSNLNRASLGAEEFVHVPQLAENRFSWEEERISGREDRRL